ncbi:XRE family transcriptional regulator [Streptomyces alboflavus]|uniref:XRE family transcriptional regulator n=1 Tax=Streptomyces alboflavus TaxID=67267 RepID=UPI001F025741|nr:XRE family transcriptional regulator [Streptomyces alboflavus]
MGENQKFAKAMDELDMSQPELVRRLNDEIGELTGREGRLTTRDVRRYLKGETRWPHAKQRIPIERVFGCPATDLGFVPRSKKAQEAPPEDSVYRRTFVTATTGTVVGAVAGAGSRTRLGLGDVERYGDEYAKIIAQDKALGGAQKVENAAVELAMRIQSDLSGSRASARTRTKLYCLASNVTCSAAFAAIDAQARTRARGHLDKAVTLAGLSGDSETQFHVWNHLSMVAVQRHDFAEVAAAADAARSQSIAKDDPLYASLAHMRRANALAGAGDRSGSLRALAAAERSFDRRAELERPPWIGFYDQAEFDGLSSLVWLKLGEPDRAESHLHRALTAIRPDLVRNRTYYSAHLALSQATQGDLELACSTGDRTAAMLGRVRSKRTSETLVKVQKIVAATGSKEPGVRAGLERARAWI